MAKSKAPTSRGEKKPPTRWEHERVLCGTEHRGFICGKPFGVFVHRENRLSKPCRRLTTEGALQCPHCDSGTVPDWRGYVPWYDESYAPRFSLIVDLHNESVSEIPHLAQVVLSRAKNPKSPCVILARQWRTSPIPPSAERASPVDLGDFLIHKLFGDKELSEWDRRQQSQPFAAAGGGGGELDKAAIRLRLKQAAMREEELRGDAIRAGDLAAKLIREVGNSTSATS